MAVTLQWRQFPNSDVATFRIYRSIIGFKGDVVPNAAIDGKTLELKLNDGPLQTVTFNLTDSIVDTINNLPLEGGKAFISNVDPNFFFVRSDIRSEPGSVEIVGGTALGDLGLIARTITQLSEDELIHTEPAAAPDDLYLFEDLDGTLEDYYTITTIDSFGNETNKGEYKQAIAFTGALALLQGTVIDLQGARKPDVKITVRLVKTPHVVDADDCPFVSCEDEITTLTSCDGTFCLPILQGALVEISIPEICFSRTVTIPNKGFVLLAELCTDLGYKYPLGFR